MVYLSYRLPTVCSQWISGQHCFDGTSPPGTPTVGLLSTYGRPIDYRRSALSGSLVNTALTVRHPRQVDGWLTVHLWQTNRLPTACSQWISGQHCFDGAAPLGRSTVGLLSTYGRPIDYRRSALSGSLVNTALTVRHLSAGRRLAYCPPMVD